MWTRTRAERRAIPPRMGRQCRSWERCPRPLGNAGTVTRRGHYKNFVVGTPEHQGNGCAMIGTQPEG